MNEWILVSERYPSVDEVRKNNVFICSDGINTTVRSYSYRLHGFITETRHGERKDRSIIAWMPLPAPYKE